MPAVRSEFLPLAWSSTGQKSGDLECAGGIEWTTTMLLVMDGIGKSVCEVLSQHPLLRMNRDDQLQELGAPDSPSV